MNNQFLKNIIRIHFFIFISLILNACGQKGDLYLPTKTQVSLSPQAVKQPALVAAQSQNRTLTKEEQEKKTTGFITEY